MPAKRDPLLTARGTRYTYAGWVRAYNAALKSGIPNLAYRLGDSYPDFYNKHYEQLRKSDLGSRQHAPNPGNPPKPKQSKPKQSKPKQSKPSAKRPVFGSPPPKPARKPATSKPKKFTKLQRQLIARGIRIERQLQDQHNRARERTLRSEQREIELRLLRLDRGAERELTRRLTEMRAQDYNRSMRDIKKKHAFTSGRFSSGTDYLN